MFIYKNSNHLHCKLTTNTKTYDYDIFNNAINEELIESINL